VGVVERRQGGSEKKGKAELETEEVERAGLGCERGRTVLRGKKGALVALPPSPRVGPPGREGV
jgi:hypothetical protein